jgi:hypothetical protein
MYEKHEKRTQNFVGITYEKRFFKRIAGRII